MGTICQTECDAEFGVTVRTCVAWIADSTNSPSLGSLGWDNTYDGSFGPWTLSDTGGVPGQGNIVANTFAELISGALTNSILLELDGSPPGGSNVWTGCNSDGSSSITDCNDWSDNTSTQTGTTGIRTSAGATWTEEETDQSCNAVLQFYCFEQPPLVP